ncbi:MAG: class I SAM-dependent methyltransferase [Candidatus Hinthialibacter antarcticus]|nr:class I SAM-dependent methyltransferase [Candidatus Hinthialibacter antarcticus]
MTASVKRKQVASRPHKARPKPLIATCPACGHHIAAPFFPAGDKPLATLAWPKSQGEAQRMKQLPLNYVCCVDCSHVFNTEFQYDEVPYSEKPNLMFNEGKNWSEFIQRMQRRIIDPLPSAPRVVEIGHGNGAFLSALSRLRPEGKFIGFDPNGAAKGSENVELVQALFQPDIHLAEIMPDIVISRHVLEHLMNPLAFLQSLQFHASSIDLDLLAYFEAPCIDRAIQTQRTVDFYYEHNSQFTSKSFSRMLSRCGAVPEDIGLGYGGEVIYGFVRMGDCKRQIEHAHMATSFMESAYASERTIKRQLQELTDAGRRVAIWGGTGKSAAFINRYELDAERFPIVVDSDPDKAGTYVPGAGQEIRYRDYLKGRPVDVLIIPPQWRARDIVAEMKRESIQVNSILIEHKGELVEFNNQY